MAGPQTRQDRLLTLIRRCRQLADECLDTQVAQHLLDLAAQHVQNSGDPGFAQDARRPPPYPSQEECPQGR
jgi:hypothetical protein